MSLKQASLLWQISHPTRDDPSYIYGTVHVKDSRAFFLMPLLDECISRCQTFASEVDLDEMNEQASAQGMLLPDDVSLLFLLGEKKFAKARTKVLQSLNVDLNLYNRVLPLLTIGALTQAVLQSDQAQPLDMHLWSLAQSKGLKTCGLETVKEQKDLLQDMGVKVQLKMLKDTLRHLTKFKHITLTMLKHYQNQRIDKLYHLAKNDLGTLKKSMVYDRNYTMVDRFSAIHTDESLFAAIGAGHLYGKYGMLQGLKKKGFKLRPASLK